MDLIFNDEQQNATISAQNVELAKEYLKLEQQNANIAVSYEREKELEIQLAQMEIQLAQTQASLTCILSSHSWRITAPIRKLLDWIRGGK